MSNLIQREQFNIGHLCTRQQCEAGLGSKVAMRWLSAAMEQIDYTFSDLEQQSNRVANLLIEVGAKPGDVVFTFLPKMPEQFFKLGAVKLIVYMQ